ncbi:hypothetical protein VTK73DRAFT_3107 [Phialemonium thermophilum]|uniref:Uncharacterized protein n=1 Tax=Phialemonium thermophilum TaxID=223376 RepID=A0ABR3VM05_9PEZI
MYALACRDGYQYSGPGPVYVTEIVPLASGLAAVASDQSLHLFHPLRLREGPSKRLRTDHGNVTAAKVYSFADSVVATAGENGTVSLWDLRLGPSAAHVLRLGEGGETSIVSLACSESTCALAAGTELAHSQASVLLWDIRHASAPRVRYNEIHSDDVTEVGPPTHLLSRSWHPRY